MTADARDMGAAFFRLFEGVPRQGPGSEASTSEAIRRLPELPRGPLGRSRVLDLGCGTGLSTRLLARALPAEVDAVDLHAPFLEALQGDLEAEGLADRVRPRQGSFLDLPDAPRSADLVWSEGSVYLAGFENGLALWAPLLTEGGVLMVSEAVWLTLNPPAEAVAFWNREYPDLTTVGERIRQAEAQGLLVFDHFLLPRSDWVTDYYRPLVERMEVLEPEAARDPNLRVVLDAMREEIAIHQAYGDTYTYAYFFMRRMPGT